MGGVSFRFLVFISLILNASLLQAVVDYETIVTKSSFNNAQFEKLICPNASFLEDHATECHSKVSSIDSLLEVLPEGYRRHYLLMFESGSLQEASYQNPRAILYGETADFVMSFNGHPLQRGYNKIETMTWIESEARFVFREVEFPADGGPLKVSKANPQKCLNCHRQDPRPNWHHYQFWPGAYGQLDDLPTRLKHSFKDPASGVFKEFDNTRAAQELPVFVAGASQRNRYRHLLEMKQRHLSTVPGRRSGGIPNQLFTAKIYDKNFKRVARLLREQPQYDLLKWLFAGAMKCDPFSPYPGQESSFPGFFPEDVRLARQDVSYKPDSVPGTRVHYNSVEYLFRMLGMDDFPYEDLFTNTQPGVGNSFESAATGGGIQIMYQLALRDPEYASFFILQVKPFRGVELGYALFDWIKDYDCHTLKAQSLKEFAKLKAQDEQLYCDLLDLPCSSKPHLAVQPAQLLKTCIDCHDSVMTSFNFASPIPFSHPDRLKRALKVVDSSGQTLLERILWRISESAPSGDRMPRNRRPLTAKEVESLTNYLSAL